MLHEFCESGASLLGKQLVIVKEQCERHAMAARFAARVIESIGDEPVLFKTFAAWAAAWRPRTSRPRSRA